MTIMETRTEPFEVGTKAVVVGTEASDEAWEVGEHGFPAGTRVEILNTFCTTSTGPAYNCRDEDGDEWTVHEDDLTITPLPRLRKLLTEPMIFQPTEEQSADEAVDMVNHPPHYTNHPSGVECIQVTEHMGFNLGNAVKYIWRCDLKKDAIEDLYKAAFYVNREIQRREKSSLSVASGNVEVSG